MDLTNNFMIKDYCKSYSTVRVIRKVESDKDNGRPILQTIVYSIPMYTK